MDSKEKTTTIPNNYNTSEEARGKFSYSFEVQENTTLQRQDELKAADPQSYSFLETQLNQEDELSAVDLRMTRPDKEVNPCSIEHYENKNDATMDHLYKNINSNDLNLVSISSDLHNTDNPVENTNYIPNLDSYKDDLNQVSHNQKIHPQKMYTLKKVSFNRSNFWNAENEVDFVLFVDQETQTQKKEFREASVQTAKDTNKCTYSLLKKKNLSQYHYPCLVCQRFYASKSSYDRHARTHFKNGNFFTNLHITKKAKFLIYGEDICKSQSHIGLPMILQEPKWTKFQCSVCSKSFSSQDARDVHRNKVVLEKFPMTKCKECHLKFFTLGALHEHVSFVHDRNTYRCNAYFCIFCNESFENSYSFQLHLDEHLSTQLSM